MTALQRLLKYPHAAVFDTSPGAELALRIRNPAGLSWEVAGTTLQLTTGQNLHWDGTFTFAGIYDWGLTRREYSLLGKTVGQLADELRADGHDVLFEGQEFAGRSAHVLVMGGGNQEESNGDHVHGYTSLLWSLYSAYAIEVEQAEVAVGQALRQMVLTQAEGDWLDVWAKLYGVPRVSDETDLDLQDRIPKEVFRLRVNGLAIEQAVQDITGETIRLVEPWRRMFTLSESALSGDHHLQDGKYFTYHVIHPVSGAGTDWASVLPVIERNKAAGVDLYAPMVDFGGWHINLQPPVEYRIENARTDVRGVGLLSSNDWVLGILTLDESEPSINHRLAQQWWQVLDNLEGLQTEQVIDPRRNVAKASICLSDGVALGDENGVLSRGAERVDFDPDPLPSDEMMLSGYTATRVVERVDRIAIQANKLGAESGFMASGVEGRTDSYPYESNEAYPLREWTGGWSGQWVPDWRHAGMVITTETA